MKGRRSLHDHEIALWRRAVREVSPLRGRPVETPPSPGPGARTPLRAETPPRDTVAAAGGAPKHAGAPHPAQAGDPRVDRLARRGRLQVDATLDLHGMTQREAHSALTQFLHHATAHRRRCVLVVTGKGGGHDGGDGRGVLRRRFSDWVNEPGLRPLVARVAQAGPRHGGAGAFYVFLKAPRQSARKL